MSRVFSHPEARAFYDRFAAKQDLQRFYEDPAIDVLLAQADFASASCIVEFGCGTGRLAARLLEEFVPAHTKYVGFDVSETMVRLAKDRVRRFSPRATVHRTEGSPQLPLADGSCDRFLSAYVLDLLGEEDIGTVLEEARRLLLPGGRLCLASLTFGNTPASRLLSRLWAALHSARPALVGGCRPLHLRALLPAGWHAAFRDVVCKFGICTEVVVAAKA